MVPFAIAAVLFGLPMRFITNGALKLGGLKRAGGFGKGVGNLAIWGIGAPFIPLLLNPFLSPVVGLLGNLGG
jgi:hypothetical protein